MQGTASGCLKTVFDLIGAVDKAVRSRVLRPEAVLELLREVENAANCGESLRKGCAIPHPFFLENHFILCRRNGLAPFATAPFDLS